MGVVGAFVSNSDIKVALGNGDVGVEVLLPLLLQFAVLLLFVKPKMLLPEFGLAATVGFCSVMLKVNLSPPFFFHMPQQSLHTATF